MCLCCPHTLLFVFCVHKRSMEFFHSLCSPQTAHSRVILSILPSQPLTTLSCCSVLSVLPLSLVDAQFLVARLPSMSHHSFASSCGNHSRALWAPCLAEDTFCLQSPGIPSRHLYTVILKVILLVEKTEAKQELRNSIFSLSC